MLIVFSGVSASGKNTIIKELTSQRANCKILEKSSGTTRPERESDKNFQTYIFYTKEEFEKGIQEGKFFEHENVHGYYYGIIKDVLDSAINDNEHFYLRDIDVHGQERLKKYCEGKARLVSIFLDAPDDVLKERLKERGESEERIKVRLSRGSMEREFKKNYDLVIDNIDMDKTLKIINEFLDNL
jgi:guanylate kinase